MSISAGIGRRPLSAVEARARVKMRAPKIAGPGWQATSSEPVSQAVSPHPPASPPSPTSITMTPVGYVRRPDGTVEAILGEGDHVQVLHEGEIFADKYKVLKITPTSVEVVEVSAAGNGRPSDLSRDMRTAQVAVTEEGGAGQQSIQSTRGSAQTTVPHRVDSAEATSQPLGYIEKANGEVVAVIADGEQVKLVKREPIVDVNSAASQQLSAARRNPPAVGRPQGNSKVVTGQVVAQQAMPGAPTLAATSIPSEVMRRVSRLLKPGIPWSEPIAYVPASLIANLRGPGTVAVPRLINSIAPVRNAPDQTARFDAKSVTLRAIGYVQWPNGHFEAVLDHEDGVYIVHEGEIFADKFKALRVSPLAVVAQDLSLQAPEGSRAPEILAMAGHELATPGTASGSRQSANEASRGHVESSGQGQIPIADPQGGNENGSATRPSDALKSAASTQTVQLWKPLGFVQKPDGEYEAIVAMGDSVYLVHKGEVFAERFKVVDMSASAVRTIEVSPDQLVPQVEPERNWAATEQLGLPQNCIISRYPPLDGTEMGQESPRTMGGGECMPRRITEFLEERKSRKPGLKLSSPMPDNGGAPR